MRRHGSCSGCLMGSYLCPPLLPSRLESQASFVRVTIKALFHVSAHEVAVYIENKSKPNFSWRGGGRTSCSFWNHKNEHVLILLACLGLFFWNIIFKIASKWIWYNTKNVVRKKFHFIILMTVASISFVFLYLFNLACSLNCVSNLTPLAHSFVFIQEFLVFFLLHQTNRTRQPHVEPPKQTGTGPYP